MFSYLLYERHIVTFSLIVLRPPSIIYLMNSNDYVSRKQGVVIFVSKTKETKLFLGQKHILQTLMIPQCRPDCTLKIYLDVSQKKGPTRKMFKHEKCRICGEQASGFNYRVVSCNACKGKRFK